MGEIAGTVAFSAIIIAVTYGAGSVWVAARSAITTVRTMIGKAVAQGMKFITAALKTFRTLFARIIKGARAAIKAFGEIRLLKTFKGKLDDILVKVKNLIDDILVKIGRVSGRLKFPDAVNHIFGPGIIKKRSKGITGGHLTGDFNAAIRGQGEILGRSRVNGFKGIERVEYKLYKMERGAITTNLQAGDNFVKTLFDPAHWSNQKLDSLLDRLFGSITTDGTHEVVHKGVTFIGWIRNGRIQSFGVK